MRGKKVMVVTLCALLLFEALAFASVSMGQQKALAEEATFYSTASDGTLEKVDFSYSGAHNATNADNVFSGIDILTIGQYFTSTLGGHYDIQRSALFFDTSSLPDDVSITSATLSLYGWDLDSTTDFDVTVVDGSFLNAPLVTGHYGSLGNQTISGGAINTIGLSISSYNDISLNAAGMGWISKTGMTNFGLRSSRDIDAIAPSGHELSFFSHEDAAGVPFRPKLVVSYEYSTASVPTMSQWGMIGMAIVLAAALVWSVRRRWVVSTGKN